jgi:hypothetical protein
LLRLFQDGTSSRSIFTTNNGSTLKVF